MLIKKIIKEHEKIKIIKITHEIKKGKKY